MKVPHIFADIASKLEDLHAIAVEGQRRDNAPDMQNVLNVNLHSGFVALGGTMHTLAKALEGSQS